MLTEPGERSSSIGEKYMELDAMAPGPRAVHAVRMARQVVHEKRLREIVVGASRELAPRYGRSISIDPYFTFSRGRLTSQRPSPWSVRVTPRFDLLCRCGSDGGVWASRGHSVFSVDSDMVILSEARTFEKDVTALHRLRDGGVLAGVQGSVRVFDPAVLRDRGSVMLSHPHSYVQPKTVAESTSGRLSIGEYGNERDDQGDWIPVGFVYDSCDGGASWIRDRSFLSSGIRHIHLLQYDSARNRLILTTGDARKEVWTRDAGGARTELEPTAGGWSRLGRRQQRMVGGATCAACTEYGTYWGTDFWLGTNYLIRQRDDVQVNRSIPPGQLRRNPLKSMGILEADGTRYVVAASVNQYARPNGSSAVFLLTEGSNTWELLILDPEGRMRPRIAECPNSTAGPELLLDLGDMSVVLGRRRSLRRHSVQADEASLDNSSNA